jgi:hypothetical protein
LFLELNQLKEVKQNKDNMSKSSTVLKTDNELTKLSSSDKSPSSTNLEKKEDSNCLEKNVINNGFQRFVPPSTTLVRRRRVIESIYLSVQRK